jgi:hypothetical protein
MKNNNPYLATHYMLPEEIEQLFYLIEVQTESQGLQ